MLTLYKNLKLSIYKEGINLYSIHKASKSVKMANGHYGQVRQMINDEDDQKEEESFEDILAEEIEKTLQEQG